MTHTNTFFKTKIILLIYILMVLSACNTDKLKTLENNTPSIKTRISKKQLRHVVLFKFKENTSKDAIARAEKAFVALPSKISQIKSFEWGINNSTEGINKGFTHCYFLSFNSEEDRAIYLLHPDHKAFGEILKPIIDDVLVVDYWAE